MTDAAGQENLVPEGQGQTGGDQGGTAQPSINPAWNDVLSVLPQEFHSQVTPHFSKWDQNYQQSIQKVHSQYEPWKPILESGVTPEDIDFAVGLMNAVSTDPKEVIQALQSWVEEEGSGSDGQQGQVGSTPQQQQSDFPFDIAEHPAFQQQKQVVDAMAQIILDQRQKEQQAAEDAQLDSLISNLKEEYKERGEFDEEFVLGVALNAGEEITKDNLKAAVEKYFGIQEKILGQKRPPGPPVLGSGGAIPNGPSSTKNLDSKDRRALVAQMLAQASQNT